MVVFVWMISKDRKKIHTEAANRPLFSLWTAGVWGNWLHILNFFSRFIETIAQYVSDTSLIFSCQSQSYIQSSSIKMIKLEARSPNRKVKTQRTTQIIQFYLYKELCFQISSHSISIAKFIRHSIEWSNTCTIPCVTRLTTKTWDVDTSRGIYMRKKVHPGIISTMIIKV